MLLMSFCAARALADARMYVCRTPPHVPHTNVTELSCQQRQQCRSRACVRPGFSRVCVYLLECSAAF